MDFVTTGDGSKTLFNADVGEHYHSKNGAFQESKHVFLHSGLKFFIERSQRTDVSILEVGFGTGLNFLLSADYCAMHKLSLDYCGIEAFPLHVDLIKQTAYDQYVIASTWSDFLRIYNQSFFNKMRMDDFVSLYLAHKKVQEFESTTLFDVIYFDAFAVSYQAEMWTDEVLAHVTKFLKPGGVFVTYAITGNLKRSMKALGFDIEKAPGAAGKREMLRAIKQIV